MPPVEAMAMGIVPIVPDVGSFHEWFNGECMLDCGIDGYLNSQPRYGGYMFAPSLKGLRKQMRWAFENQEEIKRMGEVGREYVKKNFNWKKIIMDLYYYLKQI
jgi:glycosyltransferase involved in cell wall biosynthesis